MLGTALSSKIGDFYDCGDSKCTSLDDVCLWDDFVRSMGAKTLIRPYAFKVFIPGFVPGAALSQKIV